MRKQLIIELDESGYWTVTKPGGVPMGGVDVRYEGDATGGFKVIVQMGSAAFSAMVLHNFWLDE